jgi:hypothetical protein
MDAIDAIVERHQKAIDELQRMQRHPLQELWKLRRQQPRHWRRPARLGCGVTQIQQVREIALARLDSERDTGLHFVMGGTLQGKRS